MKVNRRHHNLRRASAQRGQTFVIIMMFIGLFLLAMVGVAVDYTQVWAHRQMAQGAADAACQAGAADIFLNATDPGLSGTGGLQSFSYIGTSFDCSSKPGTPPCQYASINGYSGSNVSVTFPSSLPGVAPLTGAFTTTFPYIQVRVTDSVPMSFTKMVGNTANVTIHALAGCGVSPINVPVPLVILHKTASGALTANGASSLIKVYGGPQRSIQIDSDSTTAFSGGGQVNLSQGGPSNTGSDFAVFGGPSTQPGNINIGTTGHYIYPAVPFGDPFALTKAPSEPKAAGTAKAVPYAYNGCPDPAGCVEFTQGDYVNCSTSASLNPGDNGCLVFPYTGGSKPKFFVAANNWTPGQPIAAGTLVQPANPVCSNNGGKFIYQVQNGGTASTVCPAWPQTYGQPITDSKGVVYKNIGVATTSPATAIFDPGLYFIGANGLNLGDNSTIRMSTATGDGNLGITFYFSTTATISVTSNSGKFTGCTSVDQTKGTGAPNNCILSYKIDGTASSAATGSVTSLALKCPAGSANPAIVPSSLDGNILLGPCTGDYKSTDNNRGFLFFQSRTKSANPSWGGGGQFLSSGFMYFHSGNTGACGSSVTCLTLQGGSGSQSFTLGNIVTDELTLGGNPQINMILDPAATFEILKPTLLE